MQSEAERCGMWYVNQRWLGGTLTNFQTIRTRINYMIIWLMVGFGSAIAVVPPAYPLPAYPLIVRDSPVLKL